MKLVIYLIILVLAIAGLWKMFQKAGKPGWAAIIPIYNLVVLFEIAGRPGWWVILAFIPFVNIVIFIIAMLDLAKTFGKGTGVGLLMFFLPFIGYPYIGFSEDIKYVGIQKQVQ